MQGTGPDNISSAAVAAITAVITSLLTLPLGVLIGCCVCGLWGRKKRSGGQVDGQQMMVVNAAYIQSARATAAEEEVIYEEPGPAHVEMIPLQKNDSYGHIYVQEN